MNSLTARDTATTLSCVSFLSRQVLEVSTGRKKDEVAGVLERLSNCDRLEAVSMDMNTTFREAVQLWLPQARIVADNFHVIKHVN